MTDYDMNGDKPLKPLLKSFPVFQKVMDALLCKKKIIIRHEHPKQMYCPWQRNSFNNVEIKKSLTKVLGTEKSQ